MGVEMSWFDGVDVKPFGVSMFLSDALLLTVFLMVLLPLCHQDKKRSKSNDTNHRKHHG